VNHVGADVLLEVAEPTVEVDEAPPAELPDPPVAGVVAVGAAVPADAVPAAAPAPAVASAGTAFAAVSFPPAPAADSADFDPAVPVPVPADVVPVDPAVVAGMVVLDTCGGTAPVPAPAGGDAGVADGACEPAALATCAGALGAGAAAEPEIAGVDRPPAVTRPATIPSTTDPLAGTLVAEATTAWPSGVVETWVMSWMPAAIGEPASAAADDPAEDATLAAPDAIACEPAVPAVPGPDQSTRRSALRTGEVSSTGMAAHAPLIAFAPCRACCSLARARRTRALALTSVMPSAPATSS
jgi:hypothetical protein